MFRKSPDVIYAEKIYKIIHNGFRFAVVGRYDDEIRSQHRYEWQAKEKKKWGERVIPLESLIKT